MWTWCRGVSDVITFHSACWEEVMDRFLMDPLNHKLLKQTDQ